MPYPCRDRAVRDLKIPRASAHPVRDRILTEPAARGRMRAGDVARELSVPANPASFDLRRLAEYGLVEADPGDPDLLRTVTETGIRLTREEAEQLAGESEDDG